MLTFFGLNALTPANQLLSGIVRVRIARVRSADTFGSKRIAPSNVQLQLRVDGSRPVQRRRECAVGSAEEKMEGAELWREIAASLNGSARWVGFYVIICLFVAVRVFDVQ